MDGPLPGQAAVRSRFCELLRTGISIREGRLSSVTLLRRLGNHSRRNRIYKALRELGRVVRTITLLRFLSEPQLREQITAITRTACRRASQAPARRLEPKPRPSTANRRPARAQRDSAWTYDAALPTVALVSSPLMLLPAVDVA